MHAVDHPTENAPTADPANEEQGSYEELLEIARAHGAEEIKHLTRAYQAIAPDGGGKMIDLTALVDKVSPTP